MPVNFSCGHCGNLMAVGDEHLGQQVRCPHCQQVVVAPAAANAAPVATPVPGPVASPAPTVTYLAPQGPGAAFNDPALYDANFSISPPREEESIFTRQSEGHEDLFADPGQRPVLEMPAEPVIPTPPADMPTAPFYPGNAPVAPSVPATEASFPTVPSAPLAPETSQYPVGDSTAFIGPAHEQPPTVDAVPTTSFSADTDLAGPLSSLARRPREESMVGAIVLIFLVPYAVFMTFLAGYFYYQLRQVPSPLERMPDINDASDNPGARRRNSQSSVYERVVPDTKLPPHLHVALGQSIQIGDLQVTPEKIEQRKILYCFERLGTTPEPSQENALVLTLHLLNTSKDDEFFPTDAAFNTRWREGEPRESKPYTFLELGNSKRFYGGPIKWSPRGKSTGYRDPDPREYIQGEENGKILKPGEERNTIICTDPANREIIPTVLSHRGTVLWRVHLRRGLVDIGDREVSATAVIGVEFQAKDVQKGS